MVKSYLKETDTFFTARSIFIRLLALVYLLAFASLGSQVLGLIGEQGILRASEYLTAVEDHFGYKNFVRLPTLFWLDSSDTALVGGCFLGVLIAVLVFFGLIPVAGLFVLWLLYLSYYQVGQIFLSYQWDVLLLEVGFLSVFFSPWSLTLSKGKDTQFKMILFLLHLVLLKVMVHSGIVKILSKDPTWANFTALNYHYFTQPLPNPLSWYVHHLPDWFQKFSVGFMYFVELLVPFGIFIHRITRLAAFWFLLALQALILSTGNYGFFNLLMIALCVLLIDDKFFDRLRKWPVIKGVIIPEIIRIERDWMYWTKRTFYWIMFVGYIAVMIVQFPMIFGAGDKIPGFITKASKWVRIYAINNSYGLFAVMTTERPEIIIEGSMDGVNWKEYKFPFKVQDLDRQPYQAAPHQPRLDWQLWFASLAPDIRYTPWMMNFLQRIMEGSKPVQKLLSYDPFDGKPPRYIRAEVYMYTFTTPEERKETGHWWKREYKGGFSPPFALQEY